MCVVRVVLKAERMKRLPRPYLEGACATTGTQFDLYTVDGVRYHGTTNTVVEIKTENYRFCVVS